MEEIRTTITEEEWTEFCELSNLSYTLDAGDVQMSIKMTESAYHMQRNEHYEIVVSIDDVLYTLQPYGEDRYFAYKYTKPSPLSNIGNMLPVSYDALVYDAETKSYAAQGENETFVFYFENGKIVAGEIVMPAPDGSEVKGILYDFGTTVLNFDNVLLPNQ